MNRIIRLYSWACMGMLRYIVAVGLCTFGSLLALVMIAWFAVSGRLSSAAVYMAFYIAWVTGAFFGLGMWIFFGRKIRKVLSEAASSRR